jgi:hypothetical protein
MQTPTAASGTESRSDRHTRAVRLKSRICVALVVFAGLAGLAACGENADQRAARKTVSRFYEALKRHDATTACGLVSPAVAAAMLRASGEGQKACVTGFRQLFLRVARSADPHFFDSVPAVDSAVVDGNRAAVIFHRGYQRRRVGLTRVGGHWQITGSPDLR